MSSRDWIKVRGSWWTSPQHSEVPMADLVLGPLFMWIADRDPEWRETGKARLMRPDGSPHTVRTFANSVGLRSDRCQSAVDSLSVAGTLAVDSQGYIYFPKYRDHQESRKAASMRAKRANVHSSAEAEAEAEADIYKTETSLPSSAAKAPPAGALGLSRSQVAAWVCHWVGEARRSRGIGGTDPRPTEKRLRDIWSRLSVDGCTLMDWWTVIQRQAKQSGPADARKYLTVETLARPANFARLLQWDHIAVPPMPVVTGAPGTTVSTGPQDNECRIHNGNFERWNGWRWASATREEWQEWNEKNNGPCE